jgi:DNA-binding CsgD family transcriptional regulator
MNAIKIMEKPAGVPLRTANGHETPIAGFEVGTGLIAYDPDMAKTTDRRLGCMVLASFGLSNSRIASNLFLTANTVKTHLVGGSSNEGIPNHRAQFSRHFFDSGIFRLLKPGEIDLRPAERKVVKQVYEDKTNEQIGKTLYLAAETVKVHVQNIGKRTGWQGREQIMLAAIVSREVGNYPIYNIDLSESTSWTPEGGLIVPEPIVPTPRQEMIHERN